MLKKIITVSILSVSALAVMTANAEISTDTASQAMKSHKKHRTHYNRKALTAPTTNLEANGGSKVNQPMIESVATRQGGLPAGLYVSGQVGYANTHINSRIQNPIEIALKNDGLAGRLALGYKLNQNFAIEVGYLQLQEASINEDKSATLSNKQNALDVLGKASLPVTHNVNLYGKLGVAYLTTKLERNYNVVPGITATQDYNAVLGIDRHTWAPEVAVGMGYDITPQVSVDTSFTHIHPIGSQRPGNVDYLAVGVGYTFG
jgi:OmpA-OmpF porin, OOP family